MNRLVFAASVLAASVGIAPVAFAEPVTTVQHFHTAAGTAVTDRVTVHTKTGIVDTHATITKADGMTKTVSEKDTPSPAGGYTVSKSVTGFNGVSRSTTGHASSAAGGHAGAGHGKA